MLIYFFVFGAICAIMILYEHIPAKQKTIVAIAAMALAAFLAGCRDFTMGYDVALYGNRYFYLAQELSFQKYMALMTFDKQIEVLYSLFTYVAAQIFPNPHFLYFAESFFIMWFIYLTLKNYSEDVKYEFGNGYHIWVGLLAFLCLIYIDTFNVLRQHMSVVLVAYAFTFVRRNNKGKFLISILAATGFHYTGVLGVLLWPIYRLTIGNEGIWKNLKVSKKEKRKLFRNKILLLVICFLGLFLFGSIISNLTSLGILPSRYSEYLVDAKVEVAWMSIVSRLPVLIFLVLRRRRQGSKYIDFLIVVTIFELMLVQLKSVSLVFLRLSYFIIEIKCLSCMEIYGRGRMKQNDWYIRIGVVGYMLLYFIFQFFILSSEGFYSSEILGL